MITKITIQDAIQSFLDEMIEKRQADNDKLIAKLLVSGLPETDSKLIAARLKTETINSSYSYYRWIEYAAETMVQQVSLATHISKGVHSMSRGDNVNFKNTDNLPAYLVGSHSTPSSVIDISGNAAALPLYNFMHCHVTADTLIKDLILAKHPLLVEALAPHKKDGRKHLNAFFSFLTGVIKKPSTSKYNKQMLFPISPDYSHIGDVSALSYINIVPLFPSVFSYEVKQKIDAIRFSKERLARIQNRFDENSDNIKQLAYQSIHDLGILNLGGSKPANISKVVVMISGETLLLPSLPPDILDPNNFELSFDSASLFDDRTFLRYIRRPLNHFLSAYINSNYRESAELKKQLNVALHLLLIAIFDLALSLRDRDIGWLADHTLNINEKYWLDPNYTNAADSDFHATTRTITGWEKEVLDRTANFINRKLQKELIRGKNEFGHDTFNMWRLEAQAVIKQYKTYGYEVLT